MSFIDLGDEILFSSYITTTFYPHHTYTTTPSTPATTSGMAKTADLHRKDERLFHHPAIVQSTNQYRTSTTSSYGNRTGKRHCIFYPRMEKYVEFHIDLTF